MGRIKIELQGLNKSYYSETTVTQALRKISLKFGETGFVVITGESGSGKSTLLNMISGLDTFDDGEMFIDGQPTFQYDAMDWEEYRRNKIGFVLQDYSLVGYYTVLENVAAALLVMGVAQEQAKEEAMWYLRQVGLENFEAHRASELSSGQKQRLSIARALAKNTGILLADEPTGNLDSETGEQIVSLLKKLSKDRLVIMVTHNYDQVAEYATRRICLRDGRVVSDVQAEEEGDKSNACSGTDIDLPAPVNCRPGGTAGWRQRFCAYSRVAAYFAAMNCRAQRGKAFLYMVLLCFGGIMSFLFIGELYMQKDDIFTKQYSELVFPHKEPVRIVTKRADGRELTGKDLERIRSLTGVKTADSCDFANDINYYIEEEKDYRYLYAHRMKDTKRNTRWLSFKNKTKFMMSTDCIGEEDLAKGRMPESRNEIVLYSKDDDVLGSERMCYFTSTVIFGLNEYYGKSLTVVGILKKETEQVYFTPELCEMLSVPIDYGRYDFGYILMIAEDLKGDQARKSFKLCSEENGVEEGPMGSYNFVLQLYGEDGKFTGESVEQQLYVKPGDEDVHGMSRTMIEVSEEAFYRFYPKGRDCRQASVYLTSYAKVDSVIRKLAKMGYEAESTFRVGVTDYVQELVEERLIIVGISVAGLVIILLVLVLVLRSLMRLRLKDYQSLQSVGMRLQVARKISHFELGAYCIAAICLTVTAMWVARLAGVAVIDEILWYYNFSTYIIFVAYNIAVCVLSAASFNALLRRKLY